MTRNPSRSVEALMTDLTCDECGLPLRYEGPGIECCWCFMPEDDER